MSSPLRIDYESIPNQANKIRNTALEINDKILDVYKQVADMHAHWYGKSCLLYTSPSPRD